jgi:hypothetical protein
VEAHRDFALADADIGRHVNQVPEDLTGLRILVAVHAVVGRQMLESFESLTSRGR